MCRMELDVESFQMQSLYDWSRLVQSHHIFTGSLSWPLQAVWPDEHGLFHYWWTASDILVCQTTAPICQCQLSEACLQTALLPRTGSTFTRPRKSSTPSLGSSWPIIAGDPNIPRPSRHANTLFCTGQLSPIATSQSFYAFTQMQATLTG